MADFNFTCPSCNQLLTADDSLVGQEIACPSCSETILVQEPSDAGGGGKGMRLTVDSGSGDAGLIQKPSKPLEIAAKAAVKVCLRTFRHHDYVQDGKDTFDQVVSKFLDEVGEPNVMTVESIQYTWLDKETKTPMTDYGAMVIYRGL
jgi:DNA-directed RNA polymerase subunit RPC12/RpoP